ncbi:MAG: metal-binding protein [Polaromonas sp.]|nr:metal-binding protein [Polaromonas sp.]
MSPKNKPAPAQAPEAVARRPLLLALLGAVGLALPHTARAAASPKQITVWKTPTCGCCKEWVSHLNKNGFKATVNDVEDTAPMRQKLGLPEKYGACHTALLQGYVVEGHVPARELRRLLREKPKAVGLAVLGMPAGSPGMEMGERRDAYDVLLVLADGSARVYQSYPSTPSLPSPPSPANPSVRS